MYLGSNAISMDAKGRLAIPAKVRDALLSDCGGRIVVTAHTEERCLLVYPEQQWQQLLPQIESLPNINRKAAKMQRVLLGYATNLEVDEANGRILLPPTLREYAGLEKKLMLVGQGKKLELWGEEEWAKYLDAAGDEDEIPPEVLSLSL
ncbi:MAG: division/cell wall cluster transcriptional repressor MraZ [Oceanicoccus sp.]|uniref:division/cell wall cluster transcriptional repressor MraZ n=1 Tax=Oceanicoccus sp. TaxID=2691044 RepID=UPI00263729D2|nr:division/cell wall cluster transcriptional repressor MraZ [Oceanicoccus sp.]MCP3906649.1 division/cell wall cluster transcriptional repressor MraZ [Oceanicoccus sp.]MDG1773174.1 division/cell wall cluster transcriptional repressor MraZ [Oceanicoccus sp.]